MDEHVSQRWRHLAGFGAPLVLVLGRSKPQAPLTTLLTGSATSAGATSGGIGTSAGIGSSGGAGSSGGIGTSGATASSGSGSTTGGPAYCAPNAIWQGDLCVRLDCTDAPLLARCLLPNDGIGRCAAMTCQSFDPDTDSNNCGGYGVVCLAGSTCDGHYGDCQSSVDESNPDCQWQAAECPTGMVATFGACNGSVCVWQDCTDALRDAVCLIAPGGYTGICCGTTCIDPSASTDNCGACGRSCGDAGLCEPSSAGGNLPLLGDCIAAPPCDAMHNNLPCAIDGGYPHFGVCCLGQCLDFWPCGACGQSCTDGGVCLDGTCRDGCDATCPMGTACDQSRNAYNGPFCSPLSCAGLEDGVACTEPASLLDPMQCCGGVCLDLNSDPDNCGVCGQRCPADTACKWGFCLTPVNCANGSNGEACSRGNGLPEGICCEGSCVDWNAEPNCGGCGRTCPAGFPCQWGSCYYNVSPILAGCGSSSNGNSCFYDGGVYGVCCDGACAPFNGACLVSGSCDAGSDCTEGSVCIPGIPGVSEGICTRTDCPPGSNGVYCPFGLPLGFGTGVCCSGRCVDPAQDGDNCGGCGVHCASGVCGMSGLCQPAQADTDCSGGCAAGSVCARGLCYDAFCENPLYGPSFNRFGYPYELSPNQGDIFIFGAPYRPWGPFYCAAPDGNVGLCGPEGACSDLASDPLNCGGFGFICSSGQSCQHGVCSGASAECGSGRIGGFCNLDAGPSYLCCPGVGCIDTNLDGANCGGCGKGCPAGQGCVAGSCG